MVAVILGFNVRSLYTQVHDVDNLILQMLHLLCWSMIASMRPQ